MRVLLDTCVLSEAARRGGAKSVRERVAALRAEDTFLSVISVGEITNGIECLAPSRRKSALQAFVVQLERDFESRILGVEVETARIWGETTARARKRGKVIPPIDGLIAATALRHGLCVMTRNVGDFDQTGVTIINPWEDS